MQLLVTVQICTGMHSRGCTGFDGGFEVWEAIRGLRDRVINLEPKFKRRR